MTTSMPTRGQMERALTQRIQALYRNELGHRLNQVNCQIIDHKVVIVLENSLTQPEQLLVNNGKKELVSELHSHLDEAIRPLLIHLIQEVLGVSVSDLLTDSTFETERTGIIAILSDEPDVRSRS